MFTLDFFIHRDSDVDVDDWRLVDAGLLEYNCFLGDIHIRDESVDLSAEWGWVSVLSFVIAVRKLVASLDDGQCREFEIPDSDYHVRFARQGQWVDITTDYEDGTIRVGIRELGAATMDMLRKMRRHVEHAHPDVRRNPDYIRFLGAHIDEPVD